MAILTCENEACGEQFAGRGGSAQIRNLFSCVSLRVIKATGGAGPEWTCTAPGCGRTFRRYASQVRAPERVTCSKACQGSVYAITLVGEANPNYRDGNTLDTECACGEQKDARSARCAICANRARPIIGRSRHFPSEAEVRVALATHDSLVATAQTLGIGRASLGRLMAAMGDVDLSHMRRGRGRPRPASELFVICEGRENHAAVRAALFEADPEAYFCSECGQGPEWNGKTLVLHMDHINGIPGDNRMVNLRWLCPNCHTQTDTWTGKTPRCPEDEVLVGDLGR